MPKSREAYVDTSAFIAFMDASDRHHPLFARLFADPPPLVTTPLVIAEGQGWFLRRFDPGRAPSFSPLSKCSPRCRSSRSAPRRSPLLRACSDAFPTSR